MTDHEGAWLLEQARKYAYQDDDLCGFLIEEAITALHRGKNKSLPKAISNRDSKALGAFFYDRRRTYLKREDARHFAEFSSDMITSSDNPITYAAPLTEEDILAALRYIDTDDIEIPAIAREYVCSVKSMFYASGTKLQQSLRLLAEGKSFAEVDEVIGSKVSQQRWWQFKTRVIKGLGRGYESIYTVPRT